MLTVKDAIVACFCVALVTSSAAANGNYSSSYYPTLDWSDPFDWQLLKYGSGSSGNVLMSPVSLKIVLALLYEGAAGNTEKEFQAVLNFDNQKRANAQRFQAIIESLRSPQNADGQVQFATGVFLDSSIDPQQNFAATARYYYNADIVATNFSQSANASNLINGWIQSATAGKVLHLVDPEDVADSVLILTNALYFKGLWQLPFSKQNTKPGNFRKSPSEVLQADYMTGSGEYHYTESPELGAKILRVPYQSGRFAMFVVLPNAEDGLDDVIRRIDYVTLKQTLQQMNQVEVDVGLPKFKFSDQNSFARVLSDLGLREMFQSTASFPGIARGTYKTPRRLVVSDVIQKTGIEVDEEGTVAYAATDVQVGNKNKEPRAVFNATHPFAFFIEDQQTGSILFAGKVVIPGDADAFSNRFGDSASNGRWNSQGDPNLQPTVTNNVINSKRFNYFDLELLRELSETNNNVFVSPASLKVTLAMLHEGAYGKTAEELRNALRLEADDFKEQLQRILNDLGDGSGSTLVKSANSLFVTNQLAVKPEYSQKLRDAYNALVSSLDFSNRQQAADVINGWVNNATQGLIPDIVSPDILSVEKTLVILNAMYFKGAWKMMFTEKYTTQKCFRTPEGGCVQVPMMQIVDTFNYNYILSLDSQAISLPYADGKYAMLIILPSDRSNANMLTRDLQHDRISSILSQLEPTEVAVELPRFQIEYEVDVVEYLKQLKIRDLFGAQANLSGIVAQGNVKVSNILHKAKIEVNEKGTVAAAATGAVIIPLMGSSMPKMSMDRPFVFFIYHVESENVIFEGLLVRPGNASATRTAPRFLSRSRPAPYVYN